MVCRVLSHNKRHKTCNGWYSGMVVPIYSIVGILILYSKNVLALGSVITERYSFYGGLVTATVNF